MERSPLGPDARSRGEPGQRCLRLRRPAEFERVRQAGRSWSSALMVVQVAPNQLAASRFGVVSSKRVGKAVQRNRARRLVREAMRQLCPRLGGGWDLVIVTRASAVAASAGQVEAALEQLLRRAGLFDSPPVGS